MGGICGGIFKKKRIFSWMKCLWRKNYVKYRMKISGRFIVDVKMSIYKKDI